MVSEFKKFIFKANRTLYTECINNAESLNKLNKTFLIKIDYNKGFYMNNKRRNPVPVSKENKNASKKLFESPNFLKTIAKFI